MKNKINLLASAFYQHAIKLAEDQITPEMAQQALKEHDEDYSFSDADESQKKDILILLGRLLSAMKTKESPRSLFEKYENFIKFFSQFKGENFSEEFLDTFGGEDGDSTLEWIKTLEKKLEFNERDLLRIKYLIPVFEEFLDPEFTFSSTEQQIQFLNQFEL